MAPLAGLARRALRRRCSATSSRPTSRFPSAMAHGGITPAPRRGCSTRSIAASTARPNADRCDAPEQVMLDGNQLAEGHAFFAIGADRHHRRWPLAGLHDRHHGISPIHAAHQGSRRPARHCPDEVERVGSVVWAADNRNTFLYRRRRGAEAAVPTLAASRGHAARRRRAGISGRRRALQPRRWPHARWQVSGDGVGQPHHHRSARFCRPTSRKASSQ